MKPLPNERGTDEIATIQKAASDVTFSVIPKMSPPTFTVLPKSSPTIFGGPPATPTPPEKVAPIATAVMSKALPIFETPSVVTPLPPPPSQVTSVKTTTIKNDNMGIWSIVGGAIGSIIEPGGGTAIGGAIGGMIDSSTSGGSAGFDSYIKNTKRVGPYPDVTTLTNALMAAGDHDASQIAAIKSSYDPITGIASYGDWKIAVTSTQPITVQYFKGASETSTLRTQASLATFGAGAAGNTPIAQPNIKAGAATNSVFPPSNFGGATGVGPGPNPPGSNTVVWIVASIVALIIGFFSLKPSRK